MARSVFKTQTGQSGVIAVVAGLIIAIAPSAFGIAIRNAEGSRKADLQDWQTIVMTLAGLASGAGGLGAIAGRASAKDLVYSPSFMPGHNRQDLEIAEDPTLNNGLPTLDEDPTVPLSH